MKKKLFHFCPKIIFPLHLFKIVYDLIRILSTVRVISLMSNIYYHYCGNVLVSWAKNLQLSALNQKAFIQIETSFVLLQLVGHE